MIDITILQLGYSVSLTGDQAAGIAEEIASLRSQNSELDIEASTLLDAYNQLSNQLAKANEETLKLEQSLKNTEELLISANDDVAKANERVRKLKVGILYAIGAIEREDDESLYDANCILSSALSQLRKGQASEYEFREIGESEWTPCDKDWFDYCQKSPEHDARLRKEQE